LRTVEELLHDTPMFDGMPEDRLALVAGCGSNHSFRDGEYLLREGDSADVFYVIRHGDVNIETYVPQRGPLTLETIHDGEVLGWSWLFPPYRTMFDARAAGTVHAMEFDGRCLRGKFDDDPALGHDMVTRFLGVIAERLQATRLQLLDVYGHVAG
jgi:CRP-like cAMP-binding protein